MASFNMTSDHPWSKVIPGFVRELGDSESFVIHFHNMESYLLANALFILSKEPITEDLIRGALLRLVVKKPYLKLRIVNHFPEPGAKPVPVFAEISDMVLPFETSPATDWVRQISKEWKTKYNLANGPLWRVKHLPNVVLGKTDEEFPFETVLIFGFVHNIIDGMSYQWLYGEFLRALEAERAGSVEQPVPGKYNLPLECYIPKMSPLKGVLMNSVVNLFFGTRVIRPLTRWLMNASGNPYLKIFKPPIEEDPANPVEGSLIPIEFSREHTSAITRACKERNITVNGVIYAAATVAFAQVLHGEYLPFDYSVASHCAINLRRLAKELKDAHGLYSNVVSLSPKIPKNAAFNSEAFWKIAEFCSKTVQKMVTEEAYIPRAHMLNAIGGLVMSGNLDITDLLGKHGRDSSCILITNMGRCECLDTPPGGAFKLAGRFGGAGEHNNGSIFTSNVNTFNGQLYWSVLYSKHIVPETRAQLYANYIKHVVLRNTLPDTEI